MANKEQPTHCHRTGSLLDIFHFHRTEWCLLNLLCYAPAPMTLQHFMFYMKIFWIINKILKGGGEGNYVLLVIENNLRGLKNLKKKIHAVTFFSFFFLLEDVWYWKYQGSLGHESFLWTETRFQPQDTASDSHPLLSALLKTAPWTNHDPKS